MKKVICIKLSVLFLVLAFSCIIPKISFGQTMNDLQTQIAALLAEVQRLQAKITQMQGTPAQWCHTFNTNLMMGQNGTEITALQTALQKDGESITVTNSFDDQTASAVTGFQEKYTSDILTPNGLQHGTGRVGPSTRTKLNSLYRCGASSTCSTLWWFDSATQSCSSQRQFCGSYMYAGLQTFATQAACQAALPGTSVITNPNTPTCSTLWWFDSTTQSCSSQRQFCGSYMYYGLHTFATQAACQAAL